MTEPIRVLFFTGSFRVGGAEQYLVQMLGRFDRREIEPTVFCLDGSGALRSRVDALGIPVEVFPTGGKLVDGKSLRSLLGAVRRIRQGRFDVVQTWTNYPNVFGGLAGRIAAKAPVWLALRGIYAGNRVFLNPNRALEGLHQWVARRADGVLVNSPGLRHFVRDVEGVPEAQIRVIPNGVDEGRFRPDERVRREVRDELRLPDEVTMILYVGRLVVEKGVLDVVQAFARANLPDGVLVLVGAGRDEARLRATARELRIGERIRWLGTRSDVERILNAADVFLFPSHREGCPNALLEAMATGLPVVSTRAPGIREIVREGVDGFLVDPGDVDATARALVRFQEDSEYARSVGENARQTALRFRLDESVAAFQAVYEAAAGSRPSDRRSGRRSS